MCQSRFPGISQSIPNFLSSSPSAIPVTKNPEEQTCHLPQNPFFDDKFILQLQHKKCTRSISLAKISENIESTLLFPHRHI